MKHFIYYKLIDPENYCNHENEKKIILGKIKQNKQLVIYAPRNYGKTSLIKNIIIPQYKKQNKNAFIFFSDLLEVKDMSMLISRLQNSFEHSFSGSFPIKNIIENARNLISRIRPEVSIDPITSLPNISLKISPESKEYSIEFIFKLINDIAKKIPTIIIIDEFQDIAYIKGVQSVFRKIFESMAEVPIVVMGSKKHLLTQIFSNPDAPLAFWGEDIQLPSIDYKEYHSYIRERIEPRRLKISLESASYLQDLMYRIPEPVNILCQQIFEDYENIEITKEMINLSLKRVIESKESRYESYLSRFTSAEERICIQIAKMETVEKPQGKEFTSRCGLSHRSVKKSFDKFMDHGVIEKNNNSYRLSDPLFKYYLMTFR